MSPLLKDRRLLAELEALPELSGVDVPRNLRVSRCVRCDRCWAWKTAAAVPACAWCGGPLTTTTRLIKRATFRVLEGELLAYAERLPEGLAGRATWHRNRSSYYVQTADRIRRTGDERNADHYDRAAAREDAKVAKVERRLERLGGLLPEVSR